MNIYQFLSQHRYHNLQEVAEPYKVEIYAYIPKPNDDSSFLLIRRNRRLVFVRHDLSCWEQEWHVAYQLGRYLYRYERVFSEIGGEKIVAIRFACVWVVHMLLSQIGIY